MWQLFRQVCNELTNEIRKRKSEYLKDLDSKASSLENFGSKSWWKLVKAFLTKKGFSAEEIPPNENNGKIYYSNLEKATIFNTFFANQSTVEDNEEDAVPDVASVHSFINDIVLSTNEVTEVLKGLNPPKAVGPEQVHTQTLPASSHVIGAPYLLNRSPAEDKFPSCWKTAHVTPVYKKRK